MFLVTCVRPTATKGEFEVHGGSLSVTNVCRIVVLLLLTEPCPISGLMSPTYEYRKS